MNDTLNLITFHRHLDETERAGASTARVGLTPRTSRVRSLVGRLASIVRRDRATVAGRA